MTELILATRNPHKVQEIQAVLPREYSCRTLQDFPGAPIVLEDQETFAGNATKKSLELAHWLSCHREMLTRRVGSISGFEYYSLADDSGLEVDALNGAPGVHSARFANLEPGDPNNSSDEANKAKLLRLLAAVPPEKRTARFHCVIAITPVLKSPGQSASPVCYADEAELRVELFDGACEGHILTEARGAKGFGYDPLFVPDGYEKSFAELGQEVKNRISHRARALMKLTSFFRDR